MAEAHCNECGVSATVVTTLWRCKHCGFMECARCIDQHESKCAGPSSGGDKPTLASLQGLVDKMDRIVAILKPNPELRSAKHLDTALRSVQDILESVMSGRDDREAGVTERERQARDKAETKAHDREDAEARGIVTLDDARRRIADLEDERDAYRECLELTFKRLGQVRTDIGRALDRHGDSK